jgi:hypothetical protein
MGEVSSMSCRRVFLAALLLALTCSAVLAQSAAQSAAQAWRIETVSGLGCPVDGVTDATACINNFLAKANAANPLKLVLDGTVSMRGLVIAAAGNTWIEGLGWGSGIVIQPGSNQDGIRIGAYQGGLTEGQGAKAPARSASNIILSNFTIDAGGATNNTGPRMGFAPINQPASGDPSHPIFEVILTNATGIIVDHVRFINPTLYCLTLANVADVTVRDSSFTSSLNIQDGVHVDGPAENIRVLNNLFATGDDGIALNAPEGYGGDITDVLVDGNTFDHAWSVGRDYASLRSIPKDTHRVRRITFSHNRGTTRNTAFDLGIQGQLYAPGADQIQDILLEANDIATPMGFAMTQTPFGSVRLVGNVYDAPTTTAPMVQVLDAAAGGDLELTDNIILRNQDGHAAAPLVLVAQDTPLERLTLAGNRVIDEAGAKYAPVAYLVDAEATVGELRIDSADLTGVATLVNPAASFKYINQVSGQGVLATGVQLPDAVMANGSEYLSATGTHAGSVCVKINGRVVGNFQR